jgi:pilus assembly protein CpaB
MKPKTLILMGVAVACGLVASYMTSKLIADRNNQPPPDEKVTIAVPKKPVGKWILVKKPDDLFEMREWSKKDAPDGAIFELKDLQDKRTRNPLKGGVPLTRDDFMNKDLDGLAAMLKPGSRAVAIKVNAEALVGGFVLPGSVVDVVLTQTRGDLVTSVVLQNMTVLAIDTQANRDPEKGYTMIGATVTFAATIEESTRLRLAQSLGELALVLRAVGDDAPLDRTPVTRPSDLFKPLRKQADPDAEETSRVANGGASTSGVLPPVDRPTEDKPEVRPEVKPEVIIEDKAPGKVHRVTIIEGEVQRQDVFYWDENEKSWKRGTGPADEGTHRPPAPKVEAKSDPKPEPKPDKAETPKPVPERRGPSSKSVS